MDSAENSFQAELARNQRYRAQLVGLEAQLDSRMAELAAVSGALIEKRRSEEELLARVQQLTRAAASAEEAAGRLTGQLAAEQTRSRELLLNERSRLREQQQQLVRYRRHCGLTSPSQLSPRGSIDQADDNKPSTAVAAAADTKDVVGESRGAEAGQQQCRCKRQQRQQEARADFASRLEQRIMQMDERIERLVTEARERMEARRCSRECRAQQHEQQPQQAQRHASGEQRRGIEGEFDLPTD